MRLPLRLSLGQACGMRTPWQWRTSTVMGNSDLVVPGTTDYWDNVVSVLLNNGSGGFNSSTDYDLTSDAPESLVAADLNGDGKPDLAVVCRGVIALAALMSF